MGWGLGVFVLFLISKKNTWDLYDQKFFEIESLLCFCPDWTKNKTKSSHLVLPGAGVIGMYLNRPMSNYFENMFFSFFPYTLILRNGIVTPII